MPKGFFRVLTVAIFIFSALGIGALALFPPPWNAKKSRIEAQPRIVIPHVLSDRLGSLENPAEYMAIQDSMSVKVPLSEGEVVVSVLTDFFDGGPVEKQFVAYRNLLERESTIYLSFIDFDEESRDYKRVWSAQTAATRPGTVNLYTQDLLGDRSICVLLHGMNSLEEHTLTIFRKNPAPVAVGNQPDQDDGLFTKIAELKIDGTITIREISSPQAPQNNDSSRRQGFTISAFGRDLESSNFLDQVEIVYAYDSETGAYEERNRVKTPGAQVEQRRVRELLGNPRAFEEFISGLWYIVTAQGTVDKNQYIFFNPSSQEIIFYSDETQQVFNWQNSTATRYGLYVSSQNISVTTLRRTMDIELESLESIKVRVFEDVRLNLGVNAPWDGSYRKADSRRIQTPPPAEAYTDARYDGSLGKIHFMPDGSFELNSGGILKHGKYAFFYLNDQQLVELRSNETRSDTPDTPREVYLIEGGAGTTLTLLRVRLGARGIIRQNERPITLTLTP